VECFQSPARLPTAWISQPYSAKHTCLIEQSRGLFFLSAGYDLADEFDDSKVLKQIEKCGDVGEQIADVFHIFIDTYGLGEEGEERVHVCDLF